ncbi:mechanosensitive ion channel family protein [Rhizosaccharibacter radicis]|uniref:Small-conductance mechanosensitive channel n=1 Tax=Rhizosaccharibacter radicis TaxID=2782605 RepID=A0ABT1W107_9PROT|nr:mechanosensitive ion channel family protein [Acetobacteraceae bacterium KSS12]
MSALMIDGSAKPLLLATGLLVLSALLPRLIRRWPIWLVVTARLLVLLALTGLTVAILGSPLHPRFDSSFGATERFWKQLIEAAWWIAAARAAVGVMRLVVVLEHRPRETRIVSDLLAGVVMVATGLAIASFAFELPVRGLLATSGVIAIVLGLALQSTLSDLFSGIAVGIEHAYKPGDVLWLDSDVEGQVVQVGWRSTHILTGQHGLVVIPNSVIAKGRFINRSAPTPMRGDGISVLLDPAAPPARCQEVLGAAALACPLLLIEPPPAVSCMSLGGDGTTWHVSFSVASSAMLGQARTELLAQIHRHLRHAGIRLAVANQFPPPTWTEADAPDDAELSMPVGLLAESELFGILRRAERDALRPFFRERVLQAGDALIRQDEMPHTLFLLAEGIAEISRRDGDSRRILTRIGPGDTLGAVGLITGTPYLATAVALTRIRLFELHRDAVAEALAAHPALAPALEELAERGQAAMRRDAANTEHPVPAHPDHLRAGLRAFLQRLRGVAD